MKTKFNKEVNRKIQRKKYQTLIKNQRKILNNFIQKRDELLKLHGEEHYKVKLKNFFSNLQKFLDKAVMKKIIHINDYILKKYNYYIKFSIIKNFKKILYDKINEILIKKE